MVKFKCQLNVSSTVASKHSKIPPDSIFFQNFPVGAFPQTHSISMLLRLIFAQYVTHNQKPHLIFVAMPDLEKYGYGPVRLLCTKREAESH